MHRLRGLVAAGFVLATGISAASCSSSDTPVDTGGTGGSTGTGGADAAASSSGGSSTADAGSTGGAAAKDGGSTGGAAAKDSGVSALLHCGDKHLDPGEECDDGNGTNGDGCENSCRYTCTKGPGGDGACSNGNPCDGAETCGDDHQCHAPLAAAPDGKICGMKSKCLAGTCQPATADCGDTLIIDPEECDPPDHAACSATCLFTCVSKDPKRNCSPTDPCAAQQSCDDSIHQCVTFGPAAKDLVSCGTGKACVSGVCTDKYCSNGITDPKEQCDDGNRIQGDGCDNDCKFSCDDADPERDCKNNNACIVDGSCVSHKCTASVPQPKGTACGTKENCIEGNCVAPKCGDGVVAAGVETCDDGNAVNGDGCDNDCTPSCVNPLTDCSGTPACRVAICNNGKCDSAKDVTKNGNTCDTGGGSATCKEGACTVGTCGNSNKEAGEQCDDGNQTPGDGCEPNCTYSCTQNGQCNDGDPCSGIETCDTTVGHKCTNPSNMADSTPCGTGKICVGGECRPTYCGDGFVTAGEACDPPNTAGCDSSCKARAICDLKGDWALKVTANVSWGDPGGPLVPAAGAILQWAKLSITQTTPTLIATLRPCGITIPDFDTSILGETYGLIFPADKFDTSPNIPSFKVTGTVSGPLIGAAFEMDPIAIVLGLTYAQTLNPITEPWPPLVSDIVPANGYTILDVDNDQLPGLTAVVKTGAVPGRPGVIYSNVPVDLAGGFDNIVRGDHLGLVIRQVASQSGTVGSCTSITGATDVTKIENHIVGCNTDSGGLCPDPSLPDTVRPIYVVDPTKGGTFAAQKLASPGSTTCATVKRALP